MSDLALKPQRDERGRLLPGGPSANPKGRPRSGLALAEAIRRRIDPEEWVDELWSIARGVPRRPELRTADGSGSTVTYEPVAVKIRDRVAALSLLASYGFIKPPQQVEVSQPGGAQVDFSRLSAAEFAVLDRLIERAATDEPSPAAEPGPPTSTVLRRRGGAISSAIAGCAPPVDHDGGCATELGLPCSCGGGG